ncbi:MAG: alcohol dehydrogenase catalytic domain-containing protein [Armatimonadetes bacterium]|nr:alcohol dehydrogenase catalytic domain-containing protein [Armatimonadota bacterium]MDW8121541.1 alcohol dehydrogenase catalytic domain-containing protein [Armatimonadota bacterium]
MGLPGQKGSDFEQERFPAIAVRKSLWRFIIVRLFGARWTGVLTSPFGLVYSTQWARSPLPSKDWVRIRPLLSGICGSDLAVIKGTSSLYLAPLISFPFVLGHEIVGKVTEAGQGATDLLGKRVVVEPALGCFVREQQEPCAACASGFQSLCEKVTEGIISPGIQTGYCHDTGGGWSHEFLAHRSQVHIVPDHLADEVVVLTEPFACALHGAVRLLNEHPQVKNILVIGCGSMGLLTIAAIRALERQEGREPVRIVAVGRYDHQRHWAEKVGADLVVPDGPPVRLYPDLARESGASLHRPELGLPTVLGGFDAVIDCVGSQKSLNDSVRWARSGGSVLLIGMPAEPRVTWTAVWFKEVTVQGVYAYGVEEWIGRKIRTFSLALDLMASGTGDLTGFVSHIFPLSRWKEAVQTALRPGRYRSVKVALKPD